MQVYKELSNFNCKPKKKDQKKIKHHLYGFKVCKKKFFYRCMAKAYKKKLNKWKKKKVPILLVELVLYFKSLTDGLVKIPNIPIKLRNEIRKLHKKIGQKKFYKNLIKLDPLAKNFNFNDVKDQLEHLK